MSVPSDKLTRNATARRTPADMLEEVLGKFDAAHQQDPELGHNLRKLLEASPDLKARVAESIGAGHLSGFALLPTGENAGSRYNGHTRIIELPMESLKAAGGDSDSAAEMVFAIGHEIGHSLNRNESLEALSQLNDSVDRIARSRQTNHDYTRPIAAYIDYQRKNEAFAHIGGFNALSSQVMKNNPHADLKELYDAHPDRMGDFIQCRGSPPSLVFELKRGLTIAVDRTLPASPDNVGAMGIHYFDSPPRITKLGVGHNQDYAHHYGEKALNEVVRAEQAAERSRRARGSNDQAPEIQIDLNRLGLNRDLLPRTLIFTDSSRPKRAWEPSPDPSQTTRSKEPPTKRARTDGTMVAPAEQALESSAPATQSQSQSRKRSLEPPPDASKQTAAIGPPLKRARSDGAPDATRDGGEAHTPALYVQALKAVEALGTEAGVSGEALNNVAAALALAAQKQDLTEITGAMRSFTGYLIAFQGDMSKEQTRHCSVNIDEAKSQPAAKTLESMSQRTQSFATVAQQDSPAIHDSPTHRKLT